MPIFRYRAMSSSGKSFSGVIDADSFDSAKQRLLAQNLLLTSLKPLSKKEEKFFLPPALLLSFTRDLAQLLKAGLPLYEVLHSIEEKQKGSKAHPLLLDLCDEVKRGRSFSDALKKHPSSFDEIYISMITAAEETGELELIAFQLAAFIEKEQKLKNRLISALIYPAFLAGFAFFLLAMLLFTVVPTMRELFIDRKLHPLTAFVLGLSDFVCTYSYYLLSFFLLLCAFVWYAALKGSLQSFFRKLFSKLPLIKKVLLDSAIVRFSYALSLLLGAQVPVLRSLELAKRASGSQELAPAIDHAQKEVAKGVALSSALQASNEIPKLVVRMIATAEETGDLCGMLQSICQIYEENLDKKLQELTRFFQPAILIVLGGLIGLILLAILLPLTDVSSFLD